MLCICITLNRRIDRRKKLVYRSEILFFEAIDGTDIFFSPYSPYSKASTASTANNQYHIVNHKFIKLPQYQASNTSETLLIASKKLKRGEIGCAISHMMLWSGLLRSKESYFLILEDDALFLNTCSSFSYILDAIKKALDRLDFDICMLGRNYKINGITEVIHEPLSIFTKSEFEIDTGVTLNANNADIPLHIISPKIIGTGTHAYIISRNGAEKMLRLCCKLTDPIDVQIQKYVTSNDVTVLTTRPRLIFTFDDKISDVQRIK